MGPGSLIWGIPDNVFIDHPLDMRSGDLCLSERPGLGVEPDKDYLRAKEM